MFFKSTIFLASLFLSSLAAFNQSTKDHIFKLQIYFRNMVDSEPLQLGSSYKNAFGEEYTVKTFKYYISNISLQTTDGKNISLKGSHLINEADSTSKTISLQVPATKFKQLSFLIGVDSIYNISGMQTGDLDPLNGMFWTWNSGYIMAKFEATSPASSTVNNKVEYHIGGYKASQKTSRHIVLTLPLKSKTIINNNIVIEANANKWFDGEHALRIATNPVCTTPGKLATEFADNYSAMFKISVVN